MPENFIRWAMIKYNDRSVGRFKFFFWRRHPEIFLRIGKTEIHAEAEDCTQWFADKDWNFLTRSEAYKVAKEANQLLKDTGSRGVLYSEDIY